MKKLIAAFCLAFSLAGLAAAESKTVFSEGVWYVSKHQDPMTDKTICLAIFKDSRYVFASQGTLNIMVSGRGGVKAYEFRVDDQPAERLRGASGLERTAGSVMLRNDIDKIVNAQRVRVQIITVLDTIVFEDINLSGFKAAINFIQSECNS
jgi:hypothetical protein